jgi:hypothetical protein
MKDKIRLRQSEREREREREREGGGSFRGMRRLRERSLRARTWKMIRKITRKQLQSEQRDTRASGN